MLGVAAQLKYAPQWMLGSVGGDAKTINATGVPAGVLYNPVTGKSNVACL